MPRFFFSDQMSTSRSSSSSSSGEGARKSNRQKRQTSKMIESNASPGRPRKKKRIEEKQGNEDETEFAGLPRWEFFKVSGSLDAAQLTQRISRNVPYSDRQGIKTKKASVDKKPSEVRYASYLRTESGDILTIELPVAKLHVPYGEGNKGVIRMVQPGPKLREGFANNNNKWDYSQKPLLVLPWLEDDKRHVAQYHKNPKDFRTKVSDPDFLKEVDAWMIVDGANRTALCKELSIPSAPCHVLHPDLSFQDITAIADELNKANASYKETTLYDTLCQIKTFKDCGKYLREGRGGNTCLFNSIVHTYSQPLATLNTWSCRFYPKGHRKELQFHCWSCFSVLSDADGPVCCEKWT